MAYNQIYGIVNSATKQALGGTAVAAIDASTLAEVGGQILDNSNPATLSAFVYGLMGAINETRIKAKSYEGMGRVSLWRNTDDFGLFRRKIQRNNVLAAKENSSFKAQDADYYDGDLSANWTDRLYGLIAGFETEPEIISRKKLARCFRNPAEMASFINMLDVGRMNDIKCNMESCEMLARATSIGAAFESTNTAIDLGALYNTVTGKATAADSWLYDADLLRFCVVEMKRVIARLKSMNRVYNNHITDSVSGIRADRFTRPEETIIDVHSDFVASMNGYLQNTLIEDFIKLPNFNEVTRWQGVGTTSAYADAHKIAITNDNLGADTTDTTHVSNSGKTVTCDGIIAAVYDIDRVGLCIEDLRTVTGENTLQEMTTVVTKYDVAYAIDPSEQGIVFYVGAHNAAS